MPCLCAHSHDNLRPVDEGCAVTRAGTDPGCAHSKRVTELAEVPIPGLWKPVVHDNCLGNQITAVRNRVIADVPKPDQQALKALRKTARMLAHNLPKPEPQELGEFALAYTGAKRKRYLDAADYVRANGVEKRHAGITMFVKSERMNPQKVNPDPRPIQYRDARYCVALASYLKPLEHALYTVTLSKHPYLSGSRLVGKGLNQFERAAVLRKKWNRFANPVCFALDASRYDMHQLIEILKIEHSVYKSRYNDPQLNKLLSWQLINHCRSALGLQYTTKGRRMSGDMNTALGNCITMLCMAITIFDTLHVPYDLFDDGDDILVLCDAEHADALVALVRPEFLKFGMEMKVESVSTKFEAISWCQSSPIHTDVGWKFIRDPIKTMSCALTSTKWAGMNEKMRLQYLAGIADCELVLNQGVPVLWEFAKALQRNSRGHKARYDPTDGEYIRSVREQKVKKSSTITLEARLTFETAFGISIDQQLDFEDRLREWHFPVAGLRWDIGSRCPTTWEDIRIHIA